MTLCALIFFLACIIIIERSGCSLTQPNHLSSSTPSFKSIIPPLSSNISSFVLNDDDQDEIEDRLEYDRIPDEEIHSVKQIKNERYDSYIKDSNGLYSDERISSSSSPLDDSDSSSKNGLILGKDRVLLQLNMDLKWLFLLLTDNTQWQHLGDSISSTFIGLFDVFRSSKIMHKEVMNLISDIRFRNPRSHLRTFQGTLNQAIQHGYETGKLVVFYIEDNRSEYPSVFGSNFRKCLADERISTALNEDFIFYAATTHSHKHFKQIYQLYGKLPKFPILLVVSPYDVCAAAKISVTIGSNIKRGFFSFLRRHKLSSFGFRRRPLSLQLNLSELEKHVCAGLAVPMAELTGDGVFQFLLNAYMKNNRQRSHNDNDNGSSGVREINAHANVGEHDSDVNGIGMNTTNIHGNSNQGLDASDLETA